jgi:topoisomerase (DNA) II binding protein 1
MDDAKTIFIVTGFDASEQVRGGLEPTRREIVAPVPTTPAQISLLSLSPASPPPHREPRFPRPSQREISTLAESVDAVVDNEFTAERPFDYCVAKTTASRKYELARTLGKPIVTMAWLRDSASSGALLPTDDPATSRAYRPAAFLGLNVCVTGYTQDQRADLEAKVVANGGAYCPDLVRDACTHLVASSTTSAKFKHASKWPGVCVVKREWVDASIRDGRRADESLFVVRKETEAEAALAALKREREEDAATPWDACYLLGCRVCLYDLGAPKTSEPAKRAARLLRRGAGAVTTNPAKATHVVVSKSAAVGSLKAIKEHRDKVVYTSWLEACDVEMDVVDMDEHLVHAEMFSGGGNAAARPIAAAAVGERFNLSQEAASQGMSKGKSKPRARPAAEQEEPRRREGPASPNPLTRQALAATAAAEAQALSEAAAAKATEVGDQNVPPIESTRAKVNANDVGCSYDPGHGNGASGDRDRDSRDARGGKRRRRGRGRGRERRPVRRHEHRAQPSVVQGGRRRRARFHRARRRDRGDDANGERRAVGEFRVVDVVRRLPRGADRGGAKGFKRRPRERAQTRHVSLAREVRRGRARDPTLGGRGAEPGVSTVTVRRAVGIHAALTRQHVALRRERQGVCAHALSPVRGEVHGQLAQE